MKLNSGNHKILTDDFSKTISNGLFYFIFFFALKENNFIIELNYIPMILYLKKKNKR